MNDHWTDIADQVRRRVRRLVLVRGLACWWAVTLGLVWAATISDWTTHFDFSLTRLSLLVGVGCLSLTALWRLLLQPLLISLSDVDVARLIEQRSGGQEDQLSSAAQFRSEHQDPQLGSPDLQRSTIVKADEALNSFEVDSLFTKAPAGRALVTAAVISACTAAVMLAEPLVASIALRRFVMPLADLPWPRTTRLRFLDADLAPLKSNDLHTVAGEPLSTYVENELGALPEDLTLEMRLRDETRQQQALRTTLLRDRGGQAHEVGVVIVRALQGPVQFRVWGGDDRGTDWQTVDIVPRAGISSLSITLTPPAYTGRDSEQVEAGAGVIAGIVGSRVTIEGRANTSLSTAVIHREGRDPQPMTLNDSGRRFQTEFMLEEPGSTWYWFEILDEHGLGAPDPPRYELRGIADRPPVAYIDQPATDLTVTPIADVPLRVLARDDIGLAGLRLRHTDQVEAPATAGDDTGASPVMDAAADTVPLELSPPSTMEAVVETGWNLSSLALSAGSRLTYWVEAVDAGRVDAAGEMQSGQVGRSTRRHLQIVSATEKQRELAARQTGLLDSLEALRDRQGRAHSVTAQLRIQTDLARQLRAADSDLLKQTEQEQRNIRQQVADEFSGVAGEVQRIQRELALNGIEDLETAGRMSLLSEELQELDSRWLPLIEQHLARAHKAVDAGGDDSTEENASSEKGRATSAAPHAGVGDEMAANLRRAEESQAAALKVFDEAAKLLGGWQQRFHLSSELDAIVADQKNLQQETKEVGRETIARSAARLSPQQQADLGRLSDRQRRLATQLEELLIHPDARSSLEQDNAHALEPGPQEESPELGEAQTWLQKRGAAAEMHRAAESLKRNEIAAAADAQEDVLAALREFAERLQGTPFSDPATVIAELRDSREQAETLRKQQAELLKSAQQALSPTADALRDEQLQRLTKAQSDLAADAVDLARRLKRRQQAQAGRTADRAGSRMREAQSALEQQAADAVRVNQQEALDDLMQLAQELGELQRQAQGQLAERELQDLADGVRRLAEQQQELGDGTADLDTRRTEHGGWSRSLKLELRELINRQHALHDELEERQSALMDLAVVQASLGMAAEIMVRAGDRLDREQTGAATIALQREAAQRLTDIVESVSDADVQSAAATPPAAPSTAAQQAPPPQALLHINTQLKLLRKMQADVKRRTSELASAPERANDLSTAEELRAALIHEQGQIAELSRSLLQEVVQQETLPRQEPHEQKESQP